MKELVGKTITGIFVNEDQSILKFTTTEEDVCYIATVDCCSESWFADILVSSYSLLQTPCKVSEVEELEVPSWVSEMASRDKRTRQEYDQVYGYSIKVENVYQMRKRRGDITIIYRNSSNGYYGGDCEFVDDNLYYQKLVEESTWTQITEDWSA